MLDALPSLSHRGTQGCSLHRVHCLAALNLEKSRSGLLSIGISAVRP
jgi:hypothetical protein